MAKKPKIGDHIRAVIPAAYVDDRVVFGTVVTLLSTMFVMYDGDKPTPIFVFYKDEWRLSNEDLL